MKLSTPQRLILYSLGQFYQSLNQPLIEKPVRVQTSKIAFIELLEKFGAVSKKERALYQNLEDLEKKKLIGYENRMIKFTDAGLRELEKVERELRQFRTLEQFFEKGEKPSNRKLQTVMRIGS